MDTFNGIQRLHMFMGWQCNVRCAMCYQTDFSDRFNMPSEIYRDALKICWPRLKRVKIHGGEPTVMKNCIDLVEILTHYENLKFSISTNGILLSKFWKESLLSNGEAINFSINAARKETYNQIVKYGNYERVLGNIESLVAARNAGKNSLAITISTVVLENNIFELDELIHLAHKLGVDGVKFGTDNYLTFNGKSERSRIHRAIDAAFEAAARTGLMVEGLGALGRGYEMSLDDKKLPQELLASSMPRQVCPIPFKSLAVDADGTIRPCCNTWIKAGNLKHESIESIIHGKVLMKYRSKLSRGDYSWCIPNCLDNPRPSKTAIMRKYVSYLRDDPVRFLTKVRRKLAVKAASL